MDKTVCVKNLGCKVNAYESEYIISLFLNNGYTLLEDGASVYVINTCTVTNESDKKSRKTINSIKKHNKDAIVIAIGCYTQNIYNENLSVNLDADIILGNANKSKILEYLEEYLKTGKKIIKFYDMNYISFEDMEINSLFMHTRAFVKIQDGCNNKCSYCIIPYVRGNVRSKSKEKIINEVKSLVENGYKELVLTGIHTGLYEDVMGNDLFNLLTSLIEIEGLERIRLSSIEIVEVNDKIISLLSHPKIACHIHLPLQSGSDKILSLMNRRYDKKYYEEKVSQIRKINPDISITTDIIVGFPGEGEKEFLETYEFCKKIGFSKIHVFPFSERKGTKAVELDNKVEDKTKKCRVKKLLDLSEELKNSYEEKFKNKKLSVLIERYDNGYFYGYSSNYIEVKFKGKYKLNTICNIKYKC